MEIRDILTGLLLVASIASMLLVNRNSKRINRTHAENTDLTRIRDLRHELTETKTELREARREVGELKSQLDDLMIQVTRANAAATASYQAQMEMIRYAQMPGVTIEDWLSRFGVPHAIGGE